MLLHSSLGVTVAVEQSTLKSPDNLAPMVDFTTTFSRITPSFSALIGSRNTPARWVSLMFPLVVVAYPHIGAHAVEKVPSE